MGLADSVCTPEGVTAVNAGDVGSFCGVGGSMFDGLGC